MSSLTIIEKKYFESLFDMAGGYVMDFTNDSFRAFCKETANDVACDTDCLSLDIKRFSHSLRDFRNYIHPYEQMASKFNPDIHTAEISYQVLKATIACLSGDRK